MVDIDTTVSTGQLVVTSEVSNLLMTSPSVSTTNPFLMNTSTNQGASGHPTCHEWVWF